MHWDAKDAFRLEVMSHVEYQLSNWIANMQIDSQTKSTSFHTFFFPPACRHGANYLMVYSSVPSSLILRSLLGMVMLWATDFFPLWKKVSGVQILLAMRLLRGRMFMGPLNFNLSSFQLWRKKTSIVYSWGGRQEKKNPSNHWIFCFRLPGSWK